MPEYFLDCKLNNIHSEAFMELMPVHRTIVDEFIFAGKILSYSVSDDWKKLWIVVSVETEDQVMDIIEEFPLLKFMEIEIIQLLFYNSPQRSYAHISLN